MPGRGLSTGTNGSAAAKQTCAQCQENEAFENVRGRYMCRTCFRRYIETKCVKRMEAFRTRHSSADQHRLLLLPLSLGLSSVTLLQLLEDQLKRQVSKSGRTGFELHVLHVDDSPSVDSNNDSQSAAILERIKSRYPKHAYSICPLSDVMALPDIEDVLNQNNIDTASSTPLTDASTNDGKLLNFLSSLPSMTARTDAFQILRQRLIVSVAKSLSCEAILWSDTTTRLAEKTLSETAKGRGFSLAWAISDGPSPHGIDFYYPMRDLLKKELVAYASIEEIGLQEIAIPEKPTSTVVSAKNSSIDELMRGYFENVEANYPSIVANVVRTTGRLQAPTTATAQGDSKCGLCGLPIISAGGEDGFKVKGMTRHGIQFCHGCARSFPLSSA
ncbi:hypothetical protein AAFC00_007222 [Neodothiora populina]|uniref:Cytoplasmic tRNA 2-thiolation protein 2 n=1 Tax=Neodothiora populina TaxID=2781224 RepID=A0ABR3PHK3_9PEZI